MPPEEPQYRFRMDFAYSSNGSTVDNPIRSYITLESVTSYGTEPAAATAMNAAFAEGGFPAGISVGDTFTRAGAQMRVVQTNEQYGLPTELPSNFAHLKTLIYPGSLSQLGGADWSLPA